MKKIFFLIILLGIPAGSHALLSEDTLKNKNEGYYPTGLPLINYTSDDGVGYGARVYLYDNGSRKDPFFNESPYLMQLYGQFYTTTNGFSYHELNLDRYNVGGTRYRIKSALVYERRTNANFFGQGGDNRNSRLTDISGKEYGTYGSYEDDFLKANDYEYYKYNKFKYTMPKYWVKLVGDITRNVGFIAGLEINRVAIDTWEGHRFKGDDGHMHISGTTLLDLSRDRVKGYGGGWTNSAKAGLVYDSRDYPPDPSTGFYADYTFHAVTPALGSDFSYHRSTLGVRRYVTLAKPLVLAFRAAYTDTSSGTPFFDMPHFEFLDETVPGLGSNRTLRGFPMNRFVGETMVMGNMEARLKFMEATPGSQRFDFKLVVFADAGNFYGSAPEPFREPRFSEFKVSLGAGLVVVWNLATVIHVYYGKSRETSAVSVDFNHSI